jgi:hypothetical protein
MKMAAEDLVRRLGATVRAAELYAPTHPLVQRTANGLLAALTPALGGVPAVIVGFLEDDVVVNDFRLPRGSANLAGLLRDMRDRQVEKITFARGVDVSDIRALMDELADRTSRTAVGDRLTGRGIRRIQVSKVAIEEEDDEPVELAQAKQMYSKAVATAETIWDATKAGGQPNPGDARGIIDSLSRLVYQDRTSLLALTAVKRHDNYTFTLVRLNTAEVGLVTRTHRDDPFRPQVRLIMNGAGETLETPLLTDTWGPRRARRFPACRRGNY